jgi:hypothetical protein
MRATSMAIASASTPPTVSGSGTSTCRAGRARPGCRGQRLGCSEERGNDCRVQSDWRAAEHHPYAQWIAAIVALFRCIVGAAHDRGRGPDMNIKRYKSRARRRWPVHSAFRAAISTPRRESKARSARSASHASLASARTPRATSMCSTTRGAAAGTSGATAAPTFMPTTAPATSNGRFSPSISSGIAAPDPATDGAYFYSGTQHLQRHAREAPSSRTRSTRSRIRPIRA